MAMNYNQKDILIKSKWTKKYLKRIYILWMNMNIIKNQ